MRIRNNKEFNIKILAQHGSASASGYIIIPAGATLELTDAEWKPFATPAKAGLKNGNLEITKAPALTDEEVEAKNKAALEAAEKLIADNKEATKPAPVVEAAKPAAKPAK